MFQVNDLYKAINLLKEQCKVIPEKYTMYNGAYLFLAYPKGVMDKNKYMTPWYIVDLKRKVAGHFSPAFDLNGFILASEHLKSIKNN